MWAEILEIVSRSSSNNNTFDTYFLVKEYKTFKNELSVK